MADYNNEKVETNGDALGYSSDESDRAAAVLRDENDPDAGKSAEERAAIVR